MKEQTVLQQLDKNEFYCPATFTKSNYLIEARYNYSLLCNQLLAIALLNTKKEGDNYIARFTMTEIRRILHKNYKEFNNQVRLSADRMTETKICVENPQTGEFGYYQLIPTFKCKDGKCQVTFNPDLNHLIGDLKSNYVTLDCEKLALLDTVNSFRLYETLKSKCYYLKSYKGERTGRYIIRFSLSELKVMFNAIDINRKEIKKLFDKKESLDYDAIMLAAEKLYEAEKDLDIPSADKYSAPKWREWKDFKKRCIDPSIEQMNEKTELYVEYETQKAGRFINSVIFYVTDRSYAVKDTKAEADIDTLIDSVNDIIAEKISIKDTKLLLSTADNDIEKIKKAYDIAKSQDVDNLVGFLVSAIKNSYEKPLKSKSRVEEEKLAKKKDKEEAFLKHSGFESWEDMEKQLYNAGI